MAKGDDIKKLIGSYGRPEAFRSAALRIIADAEKRKNSTLATSLRQTLDASLRTEPAPVARSLTRTFHTGVLQPVDCA